MEDYVGDTNVRQELPLRVKLVGDISHGHGTRGCGHGGLHEVSLPWIFHGGNVCLPVHTFAFLHNFILCCRQERPLDFPLRGVWGFEPHVLASGYLQGFIVTGDSQPTDPSHHASSAVSYWCKSKSGLL